MYINLIRTLQTYYKNNPLKLKSDIKVGTKAIDSVSSTRIVVFHIHMGRVGPTVIQGGRRLSQDIFLGVHPLPGSDQSQPGAIRFVSLKKQFIKCRPQSSAPTPLPRTTG